MTLTPALKMAICRMLAGALVSSRRSECPPDFDPKMTAVAIIGGVAALGTAAYTISSQEKAKKKAEAANRQAMGMLDDNPYGSVPEAALYEPVDFDESQMDAIRGNKDALPFIRELLGQSNNFVTADALRRADKLIPNYSQSMRTMGDSTLDLLSGRLPYDDLLDIVSDRAAVGGGLNIPGLSNGQTLKDLGMSRLDAMGKGAGLMGQMVSMAETISPRSSYGKPTDFFVSPTQRIGMQMEQNQLVQQSQQSANNLAAGADPNEVARLQLGMGQVLNPPQGADYASAANQIISAAGGIYSGGKNAGYWGTPTPNAQGGYQTSMAASRSVPGGAYETVQVPGRGWQPMSEAEWYGMV